MITDAVVGVGSAYNTTDIVINHLHSRQTSCSFVRVGPTDPRNYGFGYVPNLSLLQFVSHASGIFDLLLIEVKMLFFSYFGFHVWHTSITTKFTDFMSRWALLGVDERRR